MFFLPNGPAKFPHESRLGLRNQLWLQGSVTVRLPTRHTPGWLVFSYWVWSGRLFDLLMEAPQPEWWLLSPPVLPGRSAMGAGGP